MTVTCSGPTLEVLLGFGLLLLLCAVSAFGGWIARDIKWINDELDRREEERE